MTTADPTDPPTCSARGCREAARHLVVWNNPRLHTPDREKTWAACDAHRGSLAEHLDVRGFLRRVDPLPWACATCGARFPAGQDWCPVCAGHAAGACGSRD